MLASLTAAVKARRVAGSATRGLWLAVRRRLAAMDAPLNGLSFSDQSFLARRRDWKGVQEVLIDEEYRIVADLLAGVRAPLVIDGGANIGAFALYVLSLFPEAEVHSYEPSADTMEVLLANASSHPSRHWHPHRAALWRECGSVGLEPLEWSTSRQVTPAPGGALTPARDFSQVLTDVGDRVIDLMKLDIEGAEAEFLESRRRELRRIRNLLVELHVDRIDVRPVREATRDYSRAYCVPRMDSHKPLVLWTDRNDLPLPRCAGELTSVP